MHPGWTWSVTELGSLTFFKPVLGYLHMPCCTVKKTYATPISPLKVTATHSTKGALQQNKPRQTDGPMALTLSINSHNDDSTHIKIWQ